MARVLITGADGFVGTHLRAEAEARGLEVVALERAALAEADGLEERIGKADPVGIVHLASPSPRELGTWSGLAESIATIGALVESLAASGTDAPLLVPGSAAQYGLGAEGLIAEDAPLAPVSPYGAAKCVGELAALAAPLRGDARVIWTRSFNHVGPRQPASAPVGGWVAQAVEAERAGGGAIRTGRLDRVRDFLDVRDVATAYLDLVESDASGAVNVCSGRPAPLAEVAGLVAELCGADVAVETDPALVRDVDPKSVVGDTARLDALTGFRPKYDLRRSIQDALDAARNA
jgi:GDP-4-dehydro-6-deoxy-D-mannose reductase